MQSTLHEPCRADRCDKTVWVASELDLKSRVVIESEMREESGSVWISSMPLLGFLVLVLCERWEFPYLPSSFNSPMPYHVSEVNGEGRRASLPSVALVSLHQSVGFLWGRTEVWN